MEKIDLFDLIESYLDGTLSEEKRREVEARMAEDEGFRQEVELHRGLQQNFSDPGRWRLRSALADAMEEPLESKAPVKHTIAPRVVPMHWKRLTAVAAVLVAGLCVWLLFQMMSDKPSQNSAQKAPTEQPPITVTEGPDTVKTVPKKEVPPKEDPKTQAPIAAIDPANFVPNASMEALVSGLRSEGLTFIINQPANGADLALDAKGEALLSFAGSVEGDVPDKLTLLVFNNRDVNKPLVSQTLEISGGNNFSVKRRLKALAGQYYFTIEQDGEVVYAGKFTIGKNRK